MSRAAMIEGQPLNEGERRYLSEAGRILRHLPEHARTHLLGELRLHLEERPVGGATYDALVDELGPPDDYARHLLTEHRMQAPPPRPWWVRWLAGLTILASVAAGGFLWRYFTAEPHLDNACGGLRADEFERREAAGVTEYVAAQRNNGRIGLPLCFAGLHDGPTIEAIHAPDPGRSTLAFVGTERPLPADRLNFVGDASDFTPFDLPTEGFQRGPDMIMWFEMRGCNAGSERIGSADVDYQWRGRSRTMTIPLGYFVSVGPSECSTAEMTEWHDSSERFYTVSRREHRRRSPYTLARPDEPLLERRVSEDGVAHDLCRYLWGIEPAPVGGREPRIEPLTERAVFQVEDRERAEVIIIAATEGMCPEFRDRQDELLALLD